MMHPSEETLLAVASGHADQTLRLLVEGRTSTAARPASPPARRARCRGGALLAAIGTRLRLTRSGRRCGSGSRPRRRPPRRSLGFTTTCRLPESVRQELPAPDPLAERVRQGLRFSVLMRDAFTGSYLLLGRMSPRKVFRATSTWATEDVLVLAGGYEDERGAPGRPLRLLRARLPARSDDRAGRGVLDLWSAWRNRTASWVGVEFCSRS